MRYFAFSVAVMFLYGCELLPLVSLAPYGYHAYQDAREEEANEQMSVLQGEWKQRNEQYALVYGQRVFAKDYNKVFTSVVTALSGEGMTVKNMERQSGYIFAEGPNPLPSAKATELGEESVRIIIEKTGRKDKYITGNYTYVVTVTVSQIDPMSTSVKMRLSMSVNSQDKDKYKFNELYPRTYLEVQRYLLEKIDRQTLS